MKNQDHLVIANNLQRKIFMINKKKKKSSRRNMQNRALVRFLTKRSEARKKYLNVQPVMQNQKSSGYTASIKKSGGGRGE